VPYIPFHKPSISKEDIDAVVDTLESCWLTTGPKVKEFESEFAEFMGAGNAVAVNSCTAGLHLALEAIGTSGNEAVFTTPMTFAATAEVIRYFNATPVFVDVDPDTLNIDADRLEEKIEVCHAAGVKTRAVIPVHFAGHPCRMDEIKALAAHHDLKVIEDAAHAFPASYKGKNVGCIGDITSFSFYATKTITTGEGGMITTDNDDYAERMRIMSLHGINADAWNRYAAEGDWYYEIVAPGFKYNLSDVAAALGIVQLKKATAFQQQREKIAARYNRAFSDMPEITIPAVNAEVGHSWHLYVIKLNLQTLSIDRNQIISALKKRGVGASVHFIPLHIHPYYRERYGYRPDDLPVAHESYKRIISLPIYPGMSEQKVDSVIEVLTDILRRGAR